QHLEGLLLVPSMEFHFELGVLGGRDLARRRGGVKCTQHVTPRGARTTSSRSPSSIRTGRSSRSSVDRAPSPPRSSRRPNLIPERSSRRGYCRCYRRRAESLEKDYRR